MYNNSNIKNRRAVLFGRHSSVSLSLNGLTEFHSQFSLMSPHHFSVNLDPHTGPGRANCRPEQWRSCHLFHAVKKEMGVNLPNFWPIIATPPQACQSKVGEAPLTSPFSGRHGVFVIASEAAPMAWAPASGGGGGLGWEGVLCILHSYSTRLRFSGGIRDWFGVFIFDSSLSLSLALSVSLSHTQTYRLTQ